jgi:integrase
MANPPWLEKRGTRFYAHWYDSDSGFVKRLSLRTADSAQAERRFAAFLIERGRADTQSAANVAGTVTVAMIFSDYVRERGPKIESLAIAEKAERYLTKHMGITPVTSVGMDLIDSYVQKRKDGKIGDPAGDSTIRRELGVLITAINHAISRRRLLREHAPVIERPDESEARDRWLTRDEMLRVFATALAPASHDQSGRLPRIYRFVNLAYYTASRRAALEKLTWFQVLDSQQIQLNPPGRRQTSKRRPVVPIDQALVPVMERARQEKNSEYVLDRPGSIYLEFAELMTACGLVDVSPHTLRHTRAVHLAQDGIPLYAIAGLLGDRISTVEANYLHHCPAHIRDAINSAPALDRRGSA